MNFFEIAALTGGCLINLALALFVFRQDPEIAAAPRLLDLGTRRGAVERERLRDVSRRRHASDARCRLRRRSSSSPSSSRPLGLFQTSLLIAQKPIPQADLRGLLRRCTRSSPLSLFTDWFIRACGGFRSPAALPCRTGRSRGRSSGSTSSPTPLSSAARSSFFTAPQHEAHSLQRIRIRAMLVAIVLHRIRRDE